MVLIGGKKLKICPLGFPFILENVFPQNAIALLELVIN